MNIYTLWPRLLETESEEFEFIYEISGSKRGVPGWGEHSGRTALYLNK